MYKKLRGGIFNEALLKTVGWYKMFYNEMTLIVGYKKVFFNSRNQSKSKLIPLEYRLGHNDRSESGKIFADLIK